MSPEPTRRLTFRESMEIVRLPSNGTTHRYMGRRPAWLPGSDLPDLGKFIGPGRVVERSHNAAFGGHVYAQSVLAVCKLLEDESTVQATPTRENLGSFGLHTIHGYFTLAGLSDRAFVYDVSIITRGRTFLTARVDARQPLAASTAGDAFPDSDAEQALSNICFTAVVSFAQPQPHSLGSNIQEQPAQIRYADILRSRPPTEWNPSPPADIDLLTKVLGLSDIVGTFPIVDMKKVDMGAYNEARPFHEKRELILYRLLEPLPHANAVESNAHILVHAYAADRNGLLMVANHLGFVLTKKTASLSNTFVVHCNLDEAVMEYRTEASSLDTWWLQEVSFPRTGAGRAIVHSKIWSPSGVHIATEYQDGLVVANEQVMAAIEKASL